MSLSQTTPLLPVEVLWDHLARGTTGCLSSGGSPVLRLYVMQGEVMAALCDTDGVALVRRMVNHGAITPRQGVAFARSVEQGRTAEELLLGHVPDRLFHELLRARFEENVAAFCDQDRPVALQPMDAIFVRNVQYGHDSGELVAGLLERLERTAPLRTRTQPLTLRPGPSMPSNRDEQRVAELADPALALADLVGNSPLEPLRTLEVVEGMLRAGALVSDEVVGLAPAPALKRRRPSVGEFGVEELFRLDDEPASSVEVILEEEEDLEERETLSDESDGFDESDGNGAQGDMALPPLDPVAREPALLQSLEPEPPEPEPADQAADRLEPSAAEAPAWTQPAGETGEGSKAEAAAGDDDPGDWADYTLDDEPDDPAAAPVAPPVLAEAATGPIERTVSAPALPDDGVDSARPPLPVDADETWDPDAEAARASAAAERTDLGIAVGGAEAIPASPPPPELPAAFTAITESHAAEAPQDPDEMLFAGEAPAGPDAEEMLFAGEAPAGPDAEEMLFAGDAPAGPDAEEMLFAGEAPAGPDAEEMLFGGEAPQGPDDDALFGGEAPQGPDDDALFGGAEAPGADDDFFGFDSEPEDMAMFVDQDVVRGGGGGQFSLKRDLLDVVDLREETIRRERTVLPPPVEMPRHVDDEEDLILEAMGAEDAELTEDDKVVALSFGAPPLSRDEIEHKFEVCNSVLVEVAASLDGARGRGSGATSVQLLLDGAPSGYAIIFHGLMVRKDGTFDMASAAANLARRPSGEWRALADRGIMDLIERALSMAVVELGDDEIDDLLRRIAGYQQRLRN